MSEADKQILSTLIRTAEHLNSGKRPYHIDIDLMGKADDPQVNELAVAFAALNNQYESSYAFMLELAYGHLNVEAPTNNVWISPFKQLQSELRYLTWQITQISEGDLDQHVSFSGDFSLAINKMILALRERKLLLSQVQEANAAKDKLFSIIAHDLRSPFNAIIGFSKLLMDNIHTATPDEILQYAELIHSSSKQTYDLLMNLLEWSRLQIGHIEIHPDSCDLTLLMQNILRIALLSAEPKHITLHFDDSTSHFVMTDAVIIGTIMRNLISNAIKYTPEWGHIFLTITADAMWYYISVRDTGIGISEENISKLFSLDGLHSTPGTRGEVGTGLGLVLCKDFIRMLGGNITVESQVGKGTTFTFSLRV